MRLTIRLRFLLLAAGLLLVASPRAHAQYNASENVSYTVTSGGTYTSVDHNTTDITVSFNRNLTINDSIVVDTYRHYLTWGGGGADPHDPTHYQASVTDPGIHFQVSFMGNMFDPQSSAWFSGSGTVGSGTTFLMGASWPTVGSKSSTGPSETNKYTLNTTYYAHVSISVSTSNGKTGQAGGTQSGYATAQYPATTTHLP